MKQILLNGYFGFKAVFRILIFTVAKLWQCLCFIGNPQQQVLFPIYKNLFIKKKDPPPNEASLFLEQICKKSIDTWRWIRSKRAQNLPVGCFNSVNMFFLEGTTGIRNH